MIKKSLYVVLLFLFVALFTGCGGGGGGSDTGPTDTITPPTTPEFATPEETMSNLTEALKTDNTDAALKCFTGNDQYRMKSFFNEFGQDAMKSMADDLSKAEVVSKTDTRVIYKVKALDETGNTVYVKFRAVFDNGEWKIEGL
jgi:hypothetical protein